MKKAVFLAILFLGILGSKPLYPCAQVLARLHYNLFDHSQPRLEELKRIERLEAELKSEDEESVISAIEELGRSKTEAAARALVSALKDPRYGVQMAALQTLQDADARAVPFVAELMSTSEADLQILAAQVLGELGSDAIPHLANNLTSTNEELVRISVKSLGRIGGRAALNQLEMMLDHSSWRVVNQVFDSLREMDFSAQSSIQKGLYHERSSIRALAAETLGLRGDWLAIEVLDRKLNDKDLFVRKRVIEAIGNIGDLKGLSSLFDVLKSSGVEEKTVAAGAIERIANHVVVSPDSGQKLWRLTKAFHSLRDASKSSDFKLAQAAKSARQLIQSKLIKLHPLEHWGAIDEM